MTEAYVVSMVVPQEQPDKEDDASDDIEALFSDSSDGDAAIPATTDEQMTLLASFETAHREEGTRQFMAAERDALAAMFVVHANTAREAAHMAAQEEAARVAARVAEVASVLAVQEEAARAAARAEELAVEAAADAEAWEEMARDHRRWDKDMATARRAREIHELASQRRHHRNLARCQANRAHHTDGEGSNTVDAG
jgi:hypothetical protein